MYRIDDIDTRLSLLVKIVDIFKRINTPLSAKEVQTELAKNKISVTKKTINSILFSEGKRYVSYNRDTYLYSLIEISAKDVRVSPLESVADCSADAELTASELTSSIYICNRSYSVFLKSFGSLQLFSITENGSKVKVFLNKEHPFISNYAYLFESKVNEEKSLFEDFLISLVNLNLNTPTGALRERVDDYLYSFSKELKKIISEKAS